jgi:cytochrome c5
VKLPILLKVAGWIVGVPVVLLLLDFTILRGLEVGGVAVPQPTAVTVVRLDQGWKSVEAETRDYHHTSQGTKILPYSWFMALDEPTLDPIFPRRKLASPKYLSRFGFLYDPKIDPAAPKLNLRSETREAEAAGLPIGFAIENDFSAEYADPPTKHTKVVGLTCSGCHTGRIDVEVGGGKSIGYLIDGGSAMINLSKFQDAVGRSLYFTLNFQDRWNEFGALVLKLEGKGGLDGESRATELQALKKQVAAYVTTGIASSTYLKDHKLSPVDAGFSRTDALGLIGNRVFGPLTLNNENQTVIDAPVNFPHLWDTAWFDWVQYNASIRLPMARNIGEALGVGAAVKLSKNPGDPYEYTVKVENLDWIERFLGGDDPLPSYSDEYKKGNKVKGLLPPAWDDFAAQVQQAINTSAMPADIAKNIKPIDRTSTVYAAGKALYEARCMGCHLPPRDILRKELSVEDSRYWEKDPRSGKRFLKLHLIDLDQIGTDPNQAVNFYRRFAVVPNPLQNADAYVQAGSTATISAEEGLYRITSLIRRDYYIKNQLFPVFGDKHVLLSDPKKDERLRYDRYRTLPEYADAPDEKVQPNPPDKSKAVPDGEIFLDVERKILENQAIDDVIKANLGYKARTLDGIWATPPYFHNSSVPNLYQVLQPADRRDKTFYLGTTKFDPVKVGYRTEQFYGAFLMDTTISGNRNTGHEFRNFTLEEFELAMKIKPESGQRRADRWPIALSVAEGDRIRDDQDLWVKARTRTQQILDQLRGRGDRNGPPIANHGFLGVRGVLGAEFTHAERMQLIEYLKSL